MFEQRACPLGLCDGTGFIVDDQTNTARDCGCRASRIARMQSTALKARIPKRYRGVSLDRPPALGLPEPVVATVRQYVRTISSQLENGRGLWWVGDVGTGKTTMAMIVSKAALESGHTAAIYSLPRLLGVIRDEIRGEERMADLLDRLSSVDLLHIDDLGAPGMTSWALEQLYSIVDARYQARKAIVATTNLWPDDLARQMAGQRATGPDGPGDASAEETGGGDRASEQMGKQIVSRLVEICGDPLPLFGDDKRREFRLGEPATAA